jgi:hypothetical protein
MQACSYTNASRPRDNIEPQRAKRTASDSLLQQHPSKACDFGFHAAHNVSTHSPQNMTLSFVEEAQVIKALTVCTQPPKDKTETDGSFTRD